MALDWDWRNKNGDKLTLIAQAGSPSGTGFPLDVAVPVVLKKTDYTGVLSIPGAPVAEDEPSLTLLPDAAARCLDGSPPGFYFSPATDEAHRRDWVFFLQGGGECASVQECVPHIHSPLGSSKYFPKSLSVDRNEWLAKGDPARNPDLYGWNRVFLPYCSQDLWTGTGGELNVTMSTIFTGVESISAELENAETSPVGVPVPKQELVKTLRFWGHLIFKEVLDYFDHVELLGNAKNIILSGESAGGFGVVNNVDFLLQRYPAARVVGVPIGGFYGFAYPYTGPQSTGHSSLTDFREPAWPGHAALWRSYVNEDCARAAARKNATAATCILANVTHPFLVAPMFWTEAQTDKVQITAHDWVASSSVERRFPPVLAYIAEWKRNMTVMLHNLREEHGFFSPACWVHTDMYHRRGPHISTPDGVRFSYLAAFGDWFFGRGAIPGGRLTDRDDLPLFGGDCSSRGEDSGVQVEDRRGLKWALLPRRMEEQIFV